MTRAICRLSSLAVKNLTKVGLHPDGGGLYLRVAEGGTKSWVFRYRLKGKPQVMGLGSLTVVSIAEAREKAVSYRKLLLEGVDPKQAKEEARTELEVKKSRIRTFDQVAEDYIAAHQGEWRHPKHVEQWVHSLKRYASPVFGGMPVHLIDDALVLKVLRPIWTRKPETARRVRRRIETILGYATRQKYRQGENPARWKDLLEWDLERGPVKRKHFTALPIEEMPAFMIDLREQKGIAPRALEFLTLTASRTNEVLGCRWSEIDLKQGVWTIPGERMKAGKTHRIPITGRMREILEEMRPWSGDSEYVFKSPRTGSPFSNMCFLSLLKRMKRPVTAHGFRSTFRSWVAEHTTFPRELAELSLAHAIGNAVEMAYLRSDMIEKRRQLLDSWERFCLQPGRPLAEIRSISRCPESKFRSI